MKSLLNFTPEKIGQLVNVAAKHFVASIRDARKLSDKATAQGDNAVSNYAFDFLSLVPVDGRPLKREIGMADRMLSVLSGMVASEDLDAFATAFNARLRAERSAKYGAEIETITDRKNTTARAVTDAIALYVPSVPGKVTGTLTVGEKVSSVSWTVTPELIACVRETSVASNYASRAKSLLSALIDVNPVAVSFWDGLLSLDAATKALAAQKGKKQETPLELFVRLVTSAVAGARKAEISESDIMAGLAVSVALVTPDATPATPATPDACTLTIQREAKEKKAADKLARKLAKAATSVTPDATPVPETVA
jgi:hypothetical protein